MPDESTRVYARRGGVVKLFPRKRTILLVADPNWIKLTLDEARQLIIDLEEQIYAVESRPS